MSRNGVGKFLFASVLIGLAALSAAAQSFRVQCPTSTITHPSSLTLANTEAPYSGPTVLGLRAAGYLGPNQFVNGNIKCQQISGGDGYATMGNGTQTYMFSFGALSGIADITAGLPGTEFPNVFNTVYGGTLVPGDPATTDNVTTATTSYPYKSNTTPTKPAAPFSFNGAVGLIPDLDCLSDPTCKAGIPASGLDGHVDPRQIMDVAVMNGNIPAPLMAIDEDDEFFLTLSNVGMIMRPDLFEQHTVHFHGYPNASSFYDGVPDASVAINIGGSFTYYYLAPEAGTYFWHCHITPPEHLQMGMVGQLYVRPRQDRWIGALYSGLQAQQGDLIQGDPFRERLVLEVHDGPRGRSQRAHQHAHADSNNHERNQHLDECEAPRSPHPALAGAHVRVSTMGFAMTTPFSSCASVTLRIPPSRSSVISKELRSPLA